jgi:hypothetical protein
VGNRGQEGFRQIDLPSFPTSIGQTEVPILLDIPPC